MSNQLRVKTGTRDNTIGLEVPNAWEKLFFPLPFSTTSTHICKWNHVQTKLKLYNAASSMAKDRRWKKEILSFEENLFIQNLPSWSRSPLLALEAEKQPVVSPHPHTQRAGSLLHNAYTAESIFCHSCRNEVSSVQGTEAQPQSMCLSSWGDMPCWDMTTKKYRSTWQEDQSLWLTQMLIIIPPFNNTQWAWSCSVLEQQRPLATSCPRVQLSFELPPLLLPLHPLSCFVWKHKLMATT